MRKVKAAVLVMLLAVAGCCVTKEQHGTLTESFRRYYNFTRPLVLNEILELRADVSSVDSDGVARVRSASVAALAVANAEELYLQNAELAIQKHEALHEGK